MTYYYKHLTDLSMLKAWNKDFDLRDKTPLGTRCGKIFFTPSGT